MRTAIFSALALALLAACSGCNDRRAPAPVPAPADARAPRGTFLGDLTWLEAEKLLGPSTVVVLPVGAAAKEHGPHLRLDNDLRLADYFARRVADEAQVVIAPTLGYHFYPSFAEYPGSTTLRLETARDLVVDVVKSLARHGPRRFYALNTGVSTRRALEPASAQLAEEGILLRYTDLGACLGPIEKEVAKQAGGTHADEIETSMLLYIAPDRVDMKKAVKEYTTNAASGLTRDPNSTGCYSQSGVWGDPTLATREKGARIVEAFVRALLADIEKTATEPLPTARAAP